MESHRFVKGSNVDIDGYGSNFEAVTAADQDSDQKDAGVQHAKIDKFAWMSDSAKKKPWSG